MEKNKTLSLRYLSAADPVIFTSVIALVAVILVAALINIDLVRVNLFALRDSVVANFSWLFSLTVTLLLVFSVWLACSRFGRIKLGADDSEPDFSMLSWLSMLYSAGMGIGLVFFGVAEPILHFVEPLQATPLSAQAANEALTISVFHWGLHAWGIYAVLGLALALFHFRYHQPLAIRSVLLPLLAEKTHFWPGKLIDTLAVLGTLFGLATSLGIGAIQINAGLLKLFHIDIETNTQVLIIALITVCATLSLVLGLDKGIRRLSEFNLFLAAIILLFIFLAGPTGALIRNLPQDLLNYLQALPSLSLNYAGDNFEWQKNWTLFYWAWWLSWSPFVGIFVARISKGRTIREFVIGVLLIPTAISLLWFGIFGGAALHIELFDSGTIAQAVQQNSALAIYALLEHFPMHSLTSLFAILLVAVFFITSSDSGSFVVDMLTSGGNPNPPVWQRIFWASAEGLLAIVLLIIGGLKALQAGAVSMGLPFAVILLLAVFCLIKKLTEDAAP